MIKKIYILILLLIAMGLGIYILTYNPAGESKEYHQKVEVIIEENTQANTQAVQDFLAQVDVKFTTYIQRLKPAIEDKPKWRVLWNHVTFDSEEAQQVLSEHFQEQVFADREGDKSLPEIVAELNFALEKNGNQMFMEIVKDGAQYKLDEQHLDMMSELKARIDQEMEDVSVEIAKNLGVTTVASIVAEELVRYFATATVGAAASTALTAAGAGSVAGPVGTAVGAGIGLATAYFVDMYMDDKNNEKIELELTNSINAARDKVMKQYGEFLNLKVVELDKSNKSTLLR